MKLSVPNDRRFFVGVDPSLTATGLVKLNRKGELVERATITTSPKLSIYQRVDLIAIETRKFCAGETLAIVETPYSGMSGKTTAQLAVLGFNIRACLHPIPFLNVTPSQVKQFATGSGTSHKSAMMMAVLKKWDYEPKDDNDADAYTLAQIGLAYSVGAKLKYEADVLKKVLAQHEKSLWSR